MIEFNRMPGTKVKKATWEDGLFCLLVVPLPLDSKKMWGAQFYVGDDLVREGFFDTSEEAVKNAPAVASNWFEANLKNLQDG
jgi:hypothetical protein